MRRLKHTILILAGMAILSMSCFAREKIGSQLEIDKTVHNFGDIIHKSGPVSCSFIVTNTGSQPAVIYNVVSTCGCTNVEWTREPIRPGQTGKISVTYSNDEGAYPFDKTLTTYISDSQKPVLLKVRGVSIEKSKPLDELYPVQFGPFALKESINKCGNMEQGGQKSEAVMVANLSSRPIKVGFTDTDPNLKVAVSPNPIPAGSTAEMTYTITADRKIWGKHTYYTGLLIDGNRAKSNEKGDKIGFWAFTKENFSSLTQEQKAAGPRPAFKESTYSFGKISQGQTVHASYTFKNEGKEPFCVYKVNSDATCWSHSTIPAAEPGEEVTFRIHLNTSSLPKGEHLTIVTLTTNSPLRPIVNLFIAGYIE
jgi:hypothetical protein